MAYLNNILFFTIDAIKVIFVLGLLIFIHELGHFLTAKAAGIKVHEFALGFGRKLLSFGKGETTYSIRLIPMGGFVKMEGEEEASDDERAFNKKSIGARLAVVFAGPLMNIILAFLVIMYLVFLNGTIASTQISKVVEGTNAEKVGLKAGDRIVALDGERIATWDDINWHMVRTKKKSTLITVIRDGKRESFNVETFMKLNFEVDSNNKIIGLDNDSPLQKLGFKNGDQIKKINDINVATPEEIYNVIKKQDTKELKLLVFNNKKETEKMLDTSVARRYFMGIESNRYKGNANELFIYSIYKNIFYTKLMTVGIYELFTGKVSLNQVMGPVGIISEISSQKVIQDLLFLIAIISLNLGIINLVPIPPLDGGKILTICIEGVRRKPINPETEARISMVGFSLLILLMVVATYNDILRKLAGG
ncbi:MAG: RIP metalloprotease RseP [Deltaproteobacteria bacterium]